MSTVLIKHGMIVSSERAEIADVLMRDGVVEAIGALDAQADEIIDAKGKVLLPGLIDCHVHFREPGYEHKATMKTETASASAGGVLTVCEMPNTNPPTVTVAALADKVRRASEIHGIDLYFFFGVTREEHLLGLHELFTSSSEEMQKLRKRCCGVKVYFDHSTGNQKIDKELLPAVFEACAKLNITLVGHCEDAEVIEKARSSKLEARSDIAAHSELRPPEAEAKAIEQAIALAKKYKTHFHIAHLSTKQGIDLIRAAKKDDVMISCEVAPHHLFLTVDDYQKLGTLAKMNPPLRTQDHQDALWKGIQDGIIDCIATDHAPHTLAEKQAGDPLQAPSGVPGVETMLPLLLTVTAGAWPSSPQKESHHLSMSDIHRLCFDNPKKIFNLHASPIAVRAAPRILIIDPHVPWTIHGTDLHSQCRWTPYEGWNVCGKVERIVP
jgi:dihydroorotase